MKFSKLSNNILAPCLLIASMIILILFQSVFFKISDVIYAEPEETTQSEDEISSVEQFDYISLNNIKYKPDKFFILAVISNICAFLLPAVFYIRLKGAGYSKILKFDIPKLKYLSLSIYMFFVLVLGTVLINSLTFYFGGADATVESILPLLFYTGGNPVYDMGIFIAFIILPAFCEEFFYRSVLSAEYERYGAFCAVIMTSLAFSMSHFSLRLFPSYFFAALIFYIVAKITNSVFFSMIIHALYNFCSIYLYDKLLGVLKFEQNRVIFIFIIAILFIIFLCFGLNDLEIIYYKKAYYNEPSPVYIRDKKRRNPAVVRLYRAFISPTFIISVIIFFVYVFI